MRVPDAGKASNLLTLLFYLLVFNIFIFVQGAGVASIAAMEFNDSDNIDVEVVGFGCPALLSKDLCEQLDDYVTTVIVDDDVVPRLSAPTVINALLDVMEYDYVPR